MFYGVRLTNEEKSKMFTCHPLPSILLSLFLPMTRISFLNILRPYPFIFCLSSLLISFRPSHPSLSISRNIYTSHKWTTVSITSGNFSESLWACGTINAHTLDQANEIAPVCMLPSTLIRRKSTKVQVVTTLLARHFLSWTPVERELHVFRN